MPRIASFGLPLSLLAAGCGAPRAQDPPARGTAVVGEAVAHLSPRRGTITFTAPPRGPGLAPASVDAVDVVQDGTPGSGPLGSVELVTNSVADTFSGGSCPGAAPGAQAFCGNVTLNQFYPRPLNHTFVQVTAITGADQQPLAGHGAINSDPPELGLSASLGLWKYTAPSSGTPGILGTAPDNGATRDWVFQNPDDADTSMSVRVIASLTYAGYTQAPSNLPFVDACAGGTNLGQALNSVIDLPFAFTLYDTTTTKVTAHRRGVLVAGVTGLVAPAKNVALPASGNVPGCSLLNQCAVPRPAIFPFWDTLLFLSAGGICTLEGGSAPDRTFAVTWSHLARSALADIASDYSFTVVLHEGTDVIDLLYGDMTGPLPNAAGAQAVVGVQNAAGTVATADFRQANYGSGASYTLTPAP